MNNRAYTRELLSVYGALPVEKREAFTNMFVERAHNPVIIFGLNAWLGSLGVNRFALGQVGLGLLKLFTLGGFGIWTLIDYFIIGGETREKNIRIARDIASTM